MSICPLSHLTNVAADRRYIAVGLSMFKLESPAAELRRWAANASSDETPDRLVHGVARRLCRCELPVFRFANTHSAGVILPLPAGVLAPLAETEYGLCLMPSDSPIRDSAVGAGLHPGCRGEVCRSRSVAPCGKKQ
jgi:hypothetical protein